MDLAEYASFDALGLAGLVARREISPRELALTAARAIEKANPAVNAVVETYPDRIEGLDEQRLGHGPFRGVPFLMKDVFGHEQGRRIEFASRLCRGMTVEIDTHVAELFRASGVNIIGRSNAPEYSMAGSTENALYGNTSTPWRKGYSAGGSTGGGMAAVISGMVPIAHGTDIAGSIRIPASWCGGVGLKPSRGRVSFGPALDEHGFGLATNFVQVKSVRDAAAMLDCLAVPQTGDPFRIPKPTGSYASLIRTPPAKLRIGWSAAPLAGVPVDAEIAAGVVTVAKQLECMGHLVTEVSPDCDLLAAMPAFIDIWFFAVDQRLEGYAARTGRSIGPDTLEPVVEHIYRYARTITPARFVSALAALNTARRRLATVFNACDVWLTPTMSTVSEAWGRYNLGRADVTMANLVDELYKVPFQFTLPHNIMGTPAISLPLLQHSSGLPIGIQLAARPADEHVILGVAAALEAALPWSARVPPLHVSRL